MEKEILGGEYVIYDDGRIWSRKTGQFLKGAYTSRGNKYLFYCLTVDGKSKPFYAHRLVAENFVPNPDPEHKTCVNHIDGDTFNNMACNLEWVSYKENTAHAYKLGLIAPAKQSEPCHVCGRPTRAKDAVCPACKKKLKTEALSEQRQADVNDYLGSVIDFQKITARQQEVVELRLKGLTLREIAERMRVSHQRVDQIIHAAIRASQKVKRDKQEDGKMRRAFVWKTGAFQFFDIHCLKQGNAHHN